MSLLNDDGKKYPNKGLEALAKEAPEVVKRMGYRDGESVVDSLNANPRVILNGLDAAINSKMLDLEDAQKNSGSPQYKLPAIAYYISSKTGFKLNPWVIMRTQSQVVLNLHNCRSLRLYLSKG